MGRGVETADPAGHPVMRGAAPPPQERTIQPPDRTDVTVEDPLLATPGPSAGHHQPAPGMRSAVLFTLRLPSLIPAQASRDLLPHPIPSLMCL